MHSRATLLSLPIEIKVQIFRQIALSPLSLQSSSNLLLPRPLLCEGRVIRNGYFSRDTIIPLLLTCRAVHEDVARILYGENIFVFHISGLEREYEEWKWRCEQYGKHRALGFTIFSERYWPLVRNLYVYTGYCVAACRVAKGLPGDGVISEWMDPSDAPLQEKGTKIEIKGKVTREVAASASLMRWAWPDERYGIAVNARQTITSQRDLGLEASWASWRKSDWPPSSRIVWRLVTVEDANGVVIKEFRRVASR